jgi:hypothetical protein
LEIILSKGLNKSSSNAAGSFGLYRAFFYRQPLEAIKLCVRISLQQKDLTL